MATERHRLLHSRNVLLWVLLFGSACRAQVVIPDDQETPEQRQQIAAAASQLRNKSPKERVKAAVALGNLLQNRRVLEITSINALSWAIRDPDRSVRLSAIAAVGKIGMPMPDFVPALHQAILCADPETVRAANGALDAIRKKNQSAIDAFIQKLRSTDQLERASAALQLSLFGPAAKAAAPRLVSLLSDPYPRAAENARLALAAIGRPASPFVLPVAKKLMESSRPLDIQRAIQLLRIAGPDAKDMTPRIITLLQQQDQLYADVGVLLVVDPSGELWVPEIQKMLASPDKQQRERTANWLRILARSFTPPSWLPPEGANIPIVEMLVTALDDDDDRVRQHGAGGLATLGMGAQAAVSALVRHLDDQHLVRQSCGESLRKLGPLGIKAIVENIAVSPDNYVSSPLFQLAAAATDSERKFYEAMWNPMRHEQPNLPWAVATLEASAEQGVPAIAAALKVPDPKVRESAALALLQISKDLSGSIRKLPPPDANAWDDLVALRQRGEKASNALQLAVKQTTPALQAARADDNPMVRQNAAAALKALGVSDEKP